jgi:hypothetical protein
LEKLSAFPATSLSNDTSPAAPPDTQVAVGPSFVAEAVNSELSVWSRTGSFVTGYDLNASFSVAAGFNFTDPRLTYDVLSGRWFLSGFDFDASNNSDTYLAVSTSTDPTGAWLIYTVTSHAGTITDQPKFGVSGDKVVMSWNDFTGSPLAFAGQETWVLQKSDLLAGSSVQAVSFPVDPSRSAPVPVTSLTTTSTEYVVYNNTCSGRDGIGTGDCTTGSSSLGLVAITGTPANGDVAWNESDPAITETRNPPPAAQPNSAPAISTNDDRLLSAVWQNGTLWASANDGCDPGSGTQACLRLIEVTTGGAPATIADRDLGGAGVDMYYPAVMVDSSGDPYVVATQSSASMYPSVVVLGESASSGGFVMVNLRPGTGNFSCVGCGENRWGDYSGAAIDPSNRSDVWVAGEYGTAAGGVNWGTAIGEVTFSGPTVTSVAPVTGPTTGGTQVTVQGSNFAPNTSVQFGSVAASKVVVNSATRLVATSPTHGIGPVAVTAVTPDGTSATSSTTTYTYVTPPPLPTDCVIRSRANGRYVSAELGYAGALNGVLRARAVAVGSWERYQCVAVGPNEYAIKSRANGRYVSAELAYTGSTYAVLRARTSRIGAWETFTLRQVPSCSCVALVGANSKIVSAELTYPGATQALLRARSTSIGQWEQFTIGPG